MKIYDFIFSVMNQRAGKKFTGKPQVAHHWFKW